mgnify:FL=1
MRSPPCGRTGAKAGWLGYGTRRRHATLVAIVLELTTTLTDQSVDMFDRLVGALLRTTEERHARAFNKDGRAINEKVRLYAEVGKALIAAKESGDDAFEAIGTVIPWDRFLTSVDEAGDLARPEEFDAYRLLGERYTVMRRWGPAFLAAFEFVAVPAVEPLMRAVRILREPRTQGRCRRRCRRHSSSRGGRAMSSSKGPRAVSTGVITSSVSLPSCATACVQETSG